MHTPKTASRPPRSLSRPKRMAQCVLTFLALCLPLFLLLMLAGAPANSWAQDWPNRAVRIIVPFAPGGGTDLVARMTAQKLSERYGQPFLVENRSGAGGTLGSEVVAKAFGLEGKKELLNRGDAAPFSASRSIDSVGSISRLRRSSASVRKIAQTSSGA